MTYPKAQDFGERLAGSTHSQRPETRRWVRRQDHPEKQRLQMYDAGGGGHGWHGIRARRSANAGDLEDALALDIRVLRRLGVVRAGECVCDTVRWSIDGLRAPSARLRVDLSDVERGGAVGIVANMPDGAIRQHIAIEAVQTAFGGWRCYFICPVAARRCEILYYAGGRFASREAQRLTYATQNMTDLSRTRRRALKLRGRLRGSGGQPRPRGRNRIELAEKARDAEREAITMYHDRLSAIAERSGAPRMPKAR